MVNIVSEGNCAAIDASRVQIDHSLCSYQHCVQLYLDPLLGGILHRQRRKYETGAKSSSLNTAIFVLHSLTRRVYIATV